MRSIMFMAASALLLASPALAQFPAQGMGQPATPHPLVNVPCPPSGFLPPVYNIFGRNAGDGPGYHEVATRCIGPEVRAAAEAIGMGRGVPLAVKVLTTTRFTAEGTFAVDGRTPQRVQKIDFHLNYMQPLGRMKIHRTDGPTEIRAWNDGRAWNEVTEGGAATPAAAGQALEREALAKLTPFGAIWSVAEAEGTARVTKVGGKTVISGTSPYDGFPVTVTLDAENRPESMTLRAGQDTYGATFANYRADLEPEYLYRFPDQIRWTKNGRPFADLKVTYFRNNAYVVAPVPASITPQVADRRRRITPSEGFLAQQKTSEPTPRLANGKPDMNGMWNGPNPTVPSIFAIRFPGSLESDQGAMQRAFGWNKPLYKPEFWDKVHSLDFSRVDVDPVSHCRPIGVPRQAAPMKIIQTENEMVLVYLFNRVRFIPLDGRTHREVDYDESFYDGVPAASWDGDTLVIKSIGFNDITWLQWQGYFHTDRMEVEERLRREGDRLFYSFTVTDPAVLVEPWTSDTFVSVIGRDRYAPIPEYATCEWEEPIGDLYLRG